MWRQLMLILLCLIIPWQSVKAAGGFGAHAVDAVLTIEHVLDHDLHVAHHHDDHDGGHHHDQSQDSEEHVKGHCVCSSGWLLPIGFSLSPIPPAVQLLPEWLDRPLPAPVLDKPPRPPHVSA